MTVTNSDRKMSTTENRLSNEDFRKLLKSIRSTVADNPTKSLPVTQSKTEPKSIKNEARRLRKNYYANLQKTASDKVEELSQKYRDRASERRSGLNPDYALEDNLTSMQAYKSVAPDYRSFHSAADRRKQLIQESKYLGGDMEHTHLVRGLDYALLQKIRSENDEQEIQKQQLEKLTFDKEEKKRLLTDEKVTFKTDMGRSIYHIIQSWKSRHIERQDLFLPGRMAYVIDLDEDAESDIPTTIVRSVVDVPTYQLTPIMSTNDIVINKLTQIFTSLRNGERKKNNKLRKREEHSKKRSNEDDSIYGDIGDYIPPRPKVKSTKLVHSYFDDKVQEAPDPPKISKSSAILKMLHDKPQVYAECYPGEEEMVDAIDDSDDEADFSKMDLGNKKGPVGRWDFDSVEEYSDYMNQKEALPKAAFQYGLKMVNGRRSRKGGEKNGRNQLDREWKKIQNIIKKKN